MKKYFVMALAAVLPMAFISCGSDDNGGGGGSATTLVKLSTEDAHYWGSITNTSGGETSKRTPESAELSGGSTTTMVLHYGQDVPNPGKTCDLDGVTTAKLRLGTNENPWDYEYVIGTYSTTAPNTYDLGFCTMKVHGGGTNLEFTFSDGKTATAEGQQTSYDQFNTSEVGAWACRNWKITRTAIEMTKGSTYGKAWTGCDFVQIADDIKQHADFDDAVLRQLGGIEKIRFMPCGRIYICYKRGTSKIDAGNWTLKPDQSFSWKLEGYNAGNDIINAEGTGTITFSGNTATLTMSVKAGSSGQYEGFVYFTLEPIP